MGVRLCDNADGSGLLLLTVTNLGLENWLNDSHTVGLKGFQQAIVTESTKMKRMELVLSIG